MAKDDLTDKILAALTRADERDREKGGGGTRTAAEIASWIGEGVTAARVSARLSKMAQEDLVDAYGKIEGMGNANYWRLPQPEEKNRLVVIGSLGVRRAYLNMSDEDALRRHLEQEWPEGWDAGTEADARSLLNSFEFIDTFGVYDAYAVD